ncbi:hypothetical protein [Hymenobacter perfusus]|uniref:hypothetical protein n=1 Tax=Hymenobacter perfusus TaxID=1236770 RepID=UPI001FEC6A65|nr:hypothetical protein [Hymenobacter perfusus]
MPGLVGQMLFLARRNVNIGALGVGVGLELGGLRGVVMHPHIVQGIAGEVFYAGFERIGEAGAVGGGEAGRHRLGLLAGAGGNGGLLLALGDGGGPVVGLGGGAGGLILDFGFGLGSGCFHQQGERGNSL